MNFSKENIQAASDFFKPLSYKNYCILQKHLHKGCICLITSFIPYNEIKDRKKDLALCYHNNRELSRNILYDLHYPYIKITANYKYENENTIHKEDLFIVICTDFQCTLQNAEENYMHTKSDTFKTDMECLMHEYNQNSIFLRRYTGNGEFKTEIICRNGKSETLSNGKAEQQIIDYLNKRQYPQQDSSIKKAELKLISLSFDFSYENYQGHDTMSREYNWIEFLFRKYLLEKYCKKQLNKEQSHATKRD